MNFLQNFRIGQKISIVTSVLMTLIIVSMTSFNYFNRKAEILRELDESLRADLADYYNFIRIETKKNGDILSLGINLLSAQVSNGSGISIQNNELIEYNAFNQSTQEVRKIKVPAWYISGSKVQNSERIINPVISAGISAASIFQRVPEGFLLISTNIYDLDGESITGTLIPNSDEIAQSILSGNSYSGRVFVTFDWFQTKYSPIIINGKIEGMVSVGKPEKNLTDLKKIFDEKKFYINGYPYLVSNRGSLLIHPTDEGTTISEEESFKAMQLSNQETGKIEYSYNGQAKIQYFKKVNDIASILAVTVNKKDVYKSLRELML